MGTRTTAYTSSAAIDCISRIWASRLPNVEFALNDSVSSTTTFTTFQLACGLNPGKFTADQGDHGCASEMQHNIDWARLQIASQQDSIQCQANLSRSVPNHIKVGDRVLLDRNGIKWPSYANNSENLLSKRPGPFKVLEIDQELGNFKIELPCSLKIHNVFARETIILYKEPGEHFPSRKFSRPRTNR
jgi:hypothetical protein